MTILCTASLRIGLLGHVDTKVALLCSEAMEVYEFQPGEKVVRQGDTDGAPKHSTARQKRFADHSLVGVGVNYTSWPQTVKESSSSGSKPSILTNAPKTKTTQ